MLIETLRFFSLRGVTMVYPAVIRWVLSGSVLVIGLLATRQILLARIPAERIRQPRGLMSGLRLLSWYIRRRWPALHWLSKNNTFDFTTRLSAPQIDAVARFVKQRGQARMRASDQMFIAARRLAMAAHSPAWSDAQAYFVMACDQYLAGTAFVPKEHTSLAKSAPNRFNLTDAHAALAAFADAVPVARQPWFVISGTFLGLVREGNFLAHDYDIDIGIMAADLDLDVVLDLLWARRDFAVLKVDIQPVFLSTETDVPRAVLIKLVHKTGIQIDIFIHHAGKNRNGDPVLWHGSSLHRWENTPFTLGGYQMQNLPLLGPADANDYLAECYGDWRTPVTQFDCSTDTSNLVLVRHPSTVAYFLRRVVADYETDGHIWPKLLGELVANGFIAADKTVASIQRYRLHPDLFDAS